MGDMTPSLTPAEHIAKADAAYAAAQEAHARYRARDLGELDRTTTLADYLDLVNMVNLHANMATAKTLYNLSQRSTPIVFAPGEASTT